MDAHCLVGRSSADVASRPERVTANEALQPRTPGAATVRHSERAGTVMISCGNLEPNCEFTGSEFETQIIDGPVQRIAHSREIQPATTATSSGREAALKVNNNNNKPDAALAFEPFPLDALPEPMRAFTQACARAVVCDPSYVALPLLAVLGSAIGNTRRLELKPGWQVPPILWTVVVGESGTAKTPACRAVQLLVQARQGRALARHAAALERYQKDLLRYDRELAAWRRKTDSPADPPAKPQPPRCVRYVVGDTTVEALAPLLLENPRGLLLARDELSGWIGSLDRYGSGPGSDAAHWLGMHSGEPILVDRKTGQPRTIYVPRAAMCITGGIQPGVLHRALGTAHRESGLAARLLLACPPRQPKRWTEAGVDPQLEAKVAAVLDRLYDLQPAADDHGEPCPLTLTLTPAARRLWIEFYNAHAREQAALSGELASVWSKLEEYAARLALVVHAARCAAADPALESESQVDAQSLTAGVTLARWFGHEARRVYRRLGDGDSGRDGDPGRPQRELLELIARRGGRITPRELAQTRRGYQPASVAEAALHALVGAGLGHWEFVKTASKPRRDFVLATPPASTNPSETREIDRNGDVDVWTEFSAVGKPAFPIASPEIRSLRGREDSPVGRDGVVPIEVGWSLVPASQKSG